ncbi:TIGR02757 family protein [Cytophagaceae bacterium ABcell3]|nr:TIGR02757 family protein [Cytophagaceae bacterium ABcell3]
MNKLELKDFLEEKYEAYNRPGFIENDPVCIPHLFQKKEDIEIMGLWAAVLAWGQRITIIKKCKDLITLMDGAPFDFIMNHESQDLVPFLKFKHRTFNDVDTLYFIHFFRHFYQNHATLEDAFVGGMSKGDTDMKGGLTGFHHLFFGLEEAPARTRKHVSTPARNSACKRLNMFLRWMVRKDNRGVDFGLWTRIAPNQLVCPCDVHVDRVARKLGLIQRKQTDWKTAVELTENLKALDPDDPVKYDFALFGLGVENEL